jgi:hypothetical protein
MEHERAVTIDHDKREAFRQGKKAYQHHLRIVEGQPGYYDAYVTIGLYEYIVANLPWYVNWIVQKRAPYSKSVINFE